ncbi:MAG: hypothetical protein DRO11_10400, partial [Methanobacteriota archaeon]
MAFWLLPVILGLAGAKVGQLLIGGAFGAAIGWSAGMLLGQTLLPKPHSHHPPIEDAYVSSAQYGAPIKRIMGVARVGCVADWSIGKLERHDRDEEEGKADKYFYKWSVILCEGPIKGVRTMWANGKLLFDTLTNREPCDITRWSDGNGMTVTLHRGGRRSKIFIYYGTETQDPDDIIVDYEGVGEVPAHRGVAYAVFAGYSGQPDAWGFPLDHFGNQPPRIEARIIKDIPVTVKPYIFETVELAAGETKFSPRADFASIVQEG